MQKIVIVVPTYNEAGNIEKLAGALFALPVEGLELLIVDDNSPDGTGQIADRLAASDLRVHVMHRAGKMGLGTAYVQGFRWALEYGADLIMQMDADFSHDPRYVPQLIAAAQTYDAVIGSRYVKGGSLDEQWGVERKLLSWWANRVWVGLILRMPVADATGGFRCWRRSTIVGMDLSRIKSNGYIYQVEITYLATRLGYSFVEIPIHFPDRKVGRSKMGLRVQLEAALGVFGLRMRYGNLTPKDRVIGV